MYSIVPQLVLAGLVLGSDIFFYILCFYVFPTSSIHDIKRANLILELSVTERNNMTF